jgi:hypothetical protein
VQLSGLVGERPGSSKITQARMDRCFVPKVVPLLDLQAQLMVQRSSTFVEIERAPVVTGLAYIPASNSEAAGFLESQLVSARAECREQQARQGSPTAAYAVAS